MRSPHHNLIKLIKTTDLYVNIIKLYTVFGRCTYMNSLIQINLWNTIKMMTLENTYHNTLIVHRNKYQPRNETDDIIATKQEMNIEIKRKIINIICITRRKKKRDHTI